MSPPWTDCTPHPTCTPSCVSELKLDQLFHEELDSAQATEVEAQIESCVGCQARWASRQEGLKAFPELNVEAMVAKIHVGVAEQARGAEPTSTKEEGWLRWLFGAKWIGAAALATLAIVFVLPSEESPTTHHDDVLRTKGGGEVVIFRERAGVVDRLSDRAQAQAGDRIQFELRGLSGGYLSVTGRESNGTLYPMIESLKVEPSLQAKVLIPHAFELDASVGTETLYLYHCMKPLAEGLVLDGSAVDGCNLFTQTIDKGAQ